MGSPVWGPGAGILAKGGGQVAGLFVWSWSWLCGNAGSGQPDHPIFRDMLEIHTFV